MTTQGASALQWTRPWIYAAVFAYIGIRAQLANRMPISDCDEVYNYWEELHFLLFQSGMQTWEYAPQYALRTYAYLYPLRVVMIFLDKYLPMPSSLILVLAQSLSPFPVPTAKLASFILMRSILSITMAAAELNFLNSISEHVPLKFALDRQTLVSPLVSIVTAITLLSSAGMAHAAGALLPSTTFMLAWLLSASCYVRQQVPAFCIVAVTATLGIGWPFGVIVLVPMGVHILLTTRTWTRLASILLGTAFYTALCQGVIMYIDYQHYGRWTSATLNIFQYNAAGGGDELYGVETFSYYLKNLALNFNYVAALAPLVLPVMFLRRLLRKPLPTALVVLSSSLYFWFATVGPRPHKEERFLFPVYPLICLAAVVTIQQVWITIFPLPRIRDSSSKKDNDSNEPSLLSKKKLLHHLWILLLVPAWILSWSRIAALSKYYTAPLDVYAQVASIQKRKDDQNNTLVLICTAGEWYRYPSSFYLPTESIPTHKKINASPQLAFLKSSFTGQLPRAFEREGSRAVVSTFNDENKQEMDRYVALEDCTYVVDVQGNDNLSQEGEVQLEPVYSAPFLDASSTSTLHRMIYLPFGLHNGVYLNYTLYRVKTKRN